MIAKNTVEALQSGMVFGVASQVEGIVARMIDELGEQPEDVTVDRHRIPRPAVVDECGASPTQATWLTMRGLELVFRAQHLSYGAIIHGECGRHSLDIG